MTVFRLLVWRHVIGEVPRTALTVGGVALGVAVYVAVATANVEILRSFEQAILGVAGRTTLQVSNGTGVAGGFDETIIEAILAGGGPADAPPVPTSHANGVLLAVPVVEITATIVTEGGSVILPILGVDLLAEADVRDYRVTDGSANDPDWERYLEPDAIFLGRRLAGRHGFAVGSTLEVSAGGLSRRLVVRGLLEGRGAGASTLEELAVMDIAAAQLTFERLGRLDRIDLVTDSARSVDEVSRALQAFLPPGLTVTRPDQRNAQIERMTRAFWLNVSLLSVVALLVGLFLVYNTVSFAVLRRRREVGILRALGLSPCGIARLFLAEVALIGVVGAAAGIGFGLALSNGVLQTLARTVSNLYGEVPALPQVTWAHPAVLAQGLLIGVGVAVLGSLGPIREAVSVEPTQALAPKGYETAGALRVVPALAGAALMFLLAALAALPGPVQGVPLFGYLSAFLVVLGFAWLSPLVIRAAGPCLRLLLPLRAACLARLAADELGRAPVRNAVAVSALMVGLALMIGVSTMIHSFRQTVDLWLEQTVKADLIVAPPAWPGSGPAGALPESLRGRLETIPGVTAVDSYRDVRMAFRDTPVVVVARDLMVHAKHSRYLFVDGDSRTVLAETVRADGIIISETFARQFRLGQGDRMTLPGPRGPVEFLIAGVFYDYSTDGGKVVLDRSLYARHWGDRSATVFPVYLAPGADPEAVRRMVPERLQGGPPVMILTNGDLRREVLRIFDQTFAITYALEVIAVVVALLGIANALLCGILERRRELAVLRAIGGTPAQVGRLILWESGLLGLAGTVLGLGAGLALSVLLIAVINKQSFGWTIVLYPAPWVWLEAAGLALLTTLLAGYWPARRAMRLPVAEGLQYE
ncbi:MAG: FtsX-like permease family protein [Nitrospirae bacterium]|nr:MAG: FtsX-like permease family protein [Nitrospirota bacterium]